MEYYSAIKKNTFESVLMRLMKLEPIIQSEESQRKKHQAGFRKGRRTRDQITNILWIIEKSKKFHKKIYFCFID